MWPFGTSRLDTARSGLLKTYKTEAAGAAAHQFQLARGGFFASIKELFVNIFNVIVGSIKPEWRITPHADAGKVANGLIRQQHGPKASKNALKAALGNAKAQEAAIESAGKASKVERVLSKPIRIMAKNPKLTLLTATAAGLLYMYDKHSRKQKLEALDQQAAMNQQQMMMQPGGYFDSVTPEEYAMMQSQMRLSGSQGGFANRELARRAEQQALMGGQPAVPNA